MNLQDPRQYSDVFPEANIIIQTAQCVCDGTAKESELVNVIENTLQQQNDQLINVALNLSPSLEVSQLIWQALHQAINCPSQSTLGGSTTIPIGSALNQNDPRDGSPHRVRIIAIPVILVLGSKESVQIKGELSVDELNQLLHKTTMFKDDDATFFSGTLIDPQQLSAIKLSQMYQWVRNLCEPKLWLPIDVTSSSIGVKGEGVFLRFLVGVVGNKNNTSLLNISQDNISNDLMKIMGFIHKSLHHDSVTMFAIPFAPKFLSEAYNFGLEKRTEIALHVAFSNIVRQINEHGVMPKAKVRAIPDAIEITIYCDDNPSLKEVSLWNLSKFSDFDQIVTTISNLLNDLNVELDH